MAGTGQSPVAAGEDDEQRYAVPLDVHAWGGGTFADVSPPPGVRAAPSGSEAGQPQPGQLPPPVQPVMSGFESFRHAGASALRLGGIKTTPTGLGGLGSPGGGACLRAHSGLNHSHRACLEAPEDLRETLR